MSSDSTGHLSLSPCVLDLVREYLHCVDSVGALPASKMVLQQLFCHGLLDIVRQPAVCLKEFKFTRLCDAFFFRRVYCTLGQSEGVKQSVATSYPTSGHSGRHLAAQIQDNIGSAKHLRYTPLPALALGCSFQLSILLLLIFLGLL